MAVAGFDHVSLPAQDAEAIIAFYRRLGFLILGEEEWRAGRARSFSIVLGDSKINFHGPDYWPQPEFMLRGPTALPGWGDICFVWEGGLPALQEMLRAAGAEIVERPVPRVGGRDSGRARGASVYTRDPDRNLLEFIVYDDA